LENQNQKVLMEEEKPQRNLQNIKQMSEIPGAKSKKFT